MEGPKQETLDAIASDEFVKAAIEAAIMLTYGDGRDWDKIHRSGKIPFKDEEHATVYLSLCMLVNRREPPDLEGHVNTGSGFLSVASIHALEQSFREHEEEVESR